ncbi:hypothetical protein [Bradyrhizobium prioriisuperbiae]|uniref:hypothetical protein n=1 Tax=Bradyrhizobium prioriisuperbiae TaxID=2854389 RepID=UPI0028E29819|nr:hypothetical protein [Bradyrhizobium prioritasuperba]
MFQLFLRARANNYFKSRSANRDAETDVSRIASIARSIDDAVAAAEAEWSGLSLRIEDVLARAAVTLGNDSDEYLTREPLDTHHHNLFDKEIANGQRRLEQLSQSIKHFKFLKAALLSRFPDFKMPVDTAK